MTRTRKFHTGFSLSRFLFIFIFSVDFALTKTPNKLEVTVIFNCTLGASVYELVEHESVQHGLPWLMQLQRLTGENANKLKINCNAT